MLLIKLNDALLSLHMINQEENCYLGTDPYLQRLQIRDRISVMRLFQKIGTRE